MHKVQPGQKNTIINLIIMTILCNIYTFPILIIQVIHVTGIKNLMTHPIIPKQVYIAHAFLINAKKIYDLFGKK